MRSDAIRVDQVSKTYDHLNLNLLRHLSRHGMRSNSLSATTLPIQPSLAVEEISFQILSGEIFGLIGAQGAGKSTLVRLLAALLQPDRGEIWIHGYDAIHQMAQVQRLTHPDCVYPSFFQRLSPLENLLYAAALAGLDGLPARARAVELLERLGLCSDEIHHSMEGAARTISQKTALAQALLVCPAVLLLDEPFKDLDQAACVELICLLQEIQYCAEVTILVATRQAERAQAVCNRCMYLEAGRLLEYVPPIMWAPVACASPGQIVTIS